MEKGFKTTNLFKKIKIAISTSKIILSIKKPLFKTIIYLILLMNTNNNLFANNIDLQQQQQLENLKIQKEIEEAKDYNKRNQEITTEIKEQEKQDLISDTTCYKINYITLINKNNKLNIKKIHKQVLNKYKNKCLNKYNLESLRNEINQYYINKGFTTTQVSFDIDKLRKSKEIYIVITENYVEDIEIKNDKHSNIKVKLLFPFKKKKILNLRDIEQGLDQMNRLNSNNATMEVIDNKIVINNNKSKSYKLDLDYNNSGSKTNGINQVNTSINLDNLLNINDNFFINYTDTLTNHSKKYSKSLYTSYSIPFGYWTYTTSFSNSKYFNIVKGTTIDIDYSGNTNTYINTLDKVLYRNNKYKLNTIFELETIEKLSKIRNTQLDNSTYKISNFKLSFNNTLNLYNGILIIKPTIQTGTDLFNYKKDTTNINDGKAKNDYKLYKLFIYYNKYIQNLKLFYTLQFNGQWTNKTLYSSNRIAIGGEGTVRSYKETSLSGDRGFYVKNEISSTLNNIPYIKILNNNIINKTKLSLFIDYGLVNDTYNDPNDTYNSRTGEMIGVGTSLKYSGEYVSLSIIYAKGLYASKFVKDKYGGNNKEDVVWVKVGVRY